jgi:hypothetical protein
MMAHVSRDKIFIGALAKLSADQQKQLRRSERKLVEYLARWDLVENQGGR